MISFYTYRGSFLPRLPEILLAELRNQLVISGAADDRASLAIACSTPDKFGRICNLTNDQVKALVHFAKNQKIAWQLVLMTLGSDLQTKTDVVFGYNFPRYIKAFLTRLAIPYFDLLIPENQDMAKKAVFHNKNEEGEEYTPAKLMEYIITSKPRIFTSDIMEYSQKDNKYLFKKKLETGF